MWTKRSCLESEIFLLSSSDWRSPNNGCGLGRKLANFGTGLWSSYTRDQSFISYMIESQRTDVQVSGLPSLSWIVLCTLPILKFHRRSRFCRAEASRKITFTSTQYQTLRVSVSTSKFNSLTRATSAPCLRQTGCFHNGDCFGSTIGPDCCQI